MSVCVSTASCYTPVPSFCRTGDGKMSLPTVRNTETWASLVLRPCLTNTEQDGDDVPGPEKPWEKWVLLDISRLIHG